MSRLHGTLKKQLTKVGIEPEFLEPSLMELLDMVSQTYEDHENELNMLERAMEIASEELVTANSKMMAIIEAFPDVCILLESDGTIIEFRQEESMPIVNYTERWLGRNIGDMDFGGGDGQIVNSLKGVIESGQPERHEQAVLTINGHRHYDVRMMPVAGHRALVVMRDISQRRSVEENLIREKEWHLLTLQSLAEGIITCDLSGRIEMINQVAADICGLSMNNFQGLFLWDIFELVSFQGLSNSIVCLDIAQIPNQLQIKTTDGQSKIIVQKSNLIRMPDGIVYGLVMVLSDVTEELKRISRLELSRKLEGIGQLAAGIAHEINTPMQYIGDNLHFLKEAFEDFIAFRELVVEDIWALDAIVSDPKAIREVLKRFDAERDMDYLIEEIPNAVDQSAEGVQQVRSLVLALKEFSHPGNKVSQREDINHMINNIITISRNEWRHVASIETDLAVDMPMVPCIRDEINQVLLNIVINAAQAVSDKSLAALAQGLPYDALITIKTHYSDETAYIEIKDNGPGIPQSIIDRIYDPFFTTKDVGKGTGQGLAIAYDILVNKHQGSISVESDPGNGTVFTIALPLKLASSDLQE